MSNTIVSTSPTVGGSMLSNESLQLLLYLMAGLGNPAVIWIVIRGQSESAPLFINTIIALAIAIIVAWRALTRLREYAKARQLSYVFPINMLAFGGVLAAIAVLRSSYSVSLFVSGAMGAIIVSYMLTVYNRRLRRPHYIVGGGRSAEIRVEGQFAPAPDLVELESLVEAGRLNGALVADLHHDHPNEWERLFAKAALAGVPVYHYRQVAEMQSGQVKITHLAENDLGSLIPNVPYMATKRAIDVIGSLLLLPFLLVAFVIIAALIRLDSAGNPIFLQERVGFRGRTFKMIKFRTMRPRGPIEDETAQRNDAMTKSDDDRITRLGHFLRKTRIDELPQVFNILRGEMSWIGPRPEAKSLSTWYESELPFYSYRHIVRPGVTGWAQVTQGHVTDVSDVNSKLRFDFYYVKNISLWLDFLIVLKTFRVILTGTGAK
ncbi:sugar transferase [Erythrobacter crassostreae]|uniref:Sugar transferase n=1 Tax=Erythrobacter crassostreae TaxID=2828328 RepID=A0A9X1JK32_9SPHN|nr:sugar transferase [Erythrobacter crassostrea]MBV7258521.1 sugar transferase [Erythrobacter crassostrea]